MSTVEETRALRRELAALAARPEWDLLARHDLLGRKPPQSLREHASRRGRRLLAATGFIPPHVTKYPWLPSLRHAPAAARTLVIWAPGAERDELRQVCEILSQRLKGDSCLAPVLVTDVADFAYFSRLGWLVEYLLELGGEGQSYRERERRYRAWRYREARIVPMNSELASDSEWTPVREVSC